MGDTATATKAAKQGRKSRVTSLSMYQGNGYTIYVRVCGHTFLVVRPIIVLLLLMFLTFEGLHDYRKLNHKMNAREISEGKLLAR